MRVRSVSVPRVMAVAALVVAPAACFNDPVVPPRFHGFVVTGTVTNRTGAEIPAGARVLVAWTVSATTPDYNYIFGEGVLEDGGTAFRVEIERIPPALALNSGILGVGMVIVTTDQAATVGDDLAAIPEETVLGAAGRYGIIYVDRTNNPANLLDWVERFPDGYSIGRGVDIEDGFDEFTPVATDEIEIILDDLDAIDFVNWT